ncbi:MAG TPA: ECF transporter S component [Candidatus Limiplasma sp.]|nr:ECF transporter S component [Candidatus Limiplasma sp.]
MSKSTKSLALSAMFLALCFVLPYLTGNNYQLGSMLLLMHIPVLLCGLSCGWQWGLGVGFIAPLLRSLLVGAPPMPNTAVPMAFELAAYGMFAGLIYHWLDTATIKSFGSMSENTKTTVKLYISLLLAMLLGRIVWGLVKYAFVSLFIPDGVFTMAAFLSGAFIIAWPGIVIQLVIIPPIILALKRAKLTIQ